MKTKRLLSVLKRLALGAIVILVILAGVSYAWYQLTLYERGPDQQGYLALEGGTVLVGEQLERRSNTTVLIRDGTIVQIANDDAIEIPADAVRLDLRGYTVMPGLVDLHVHLGGPEMELGEELGAAQIADLILEWLRYVPGARRSFLRHGVTSVRDLGNDYEWIMELRQRLRDGELEGPRLFAAGPLFTTPRGHPVVTIFANDPRAQ